MCILHSQTRKKCQMRVLEKYYSCFHFCPVRCCAEELSKFLSFLPAAQPTGLGRESVDVADAVVIEITSEVQVF